MPKLIGRETLKQKLDSGENMHLVEVLSEKEFERCHIAGAVNIAFNRIGTEAQKRFGKDEQIVLYCMDSNCRASPIAAEKLEKMGFSNVSIYSGGKTDWVAAQLPTQGRESYNSD